jgi:RNA polymerase sigma-70 factor, ECF subfamily
VTRPTDAELLEQWAGGTSAAGNSLLCRYYDELRGFLINSVPPEDCADVLHDIFLGVLNRAAAFEGRSSFRTYLYKVARNQIADYYRKRYTDKGMFDPATHSVEDLGERKLSSAVAFRQRLRRVNACLLSMPVAARLMIELRYWREFSASELGEIFDLTAGAVRVRLHRYRETLMAKMEEVLDQADERWMPGELEAVLRGVGLELGIVAVENRREAR